MSRDFTPQIIYFVNKQYNNLYLNNIIFTDNTTGKSHKMFTDEEMRIRYKYPTFATLYTDNFIKLYHDLPSYKIRHVFEYMDEILKDITYADENGWSLNSYPETIIKWYKGELDPNFYYHEHNDDLLHEWIMKYIAN